MVSSQNSVFAIRSSLMMRDVGIFVHLIGATYEGVIIDLQIQTARESDTNDTKGLQD